VGGTLTGYRDGRQQLPVPDGSCDLTAHVLMGSLLDPGDRLLRQRVVLAALGVDATPRGYAGDSAAHLTALAQAGEAAELTDPSGLGGFSWLLHPAGPRSAIMTLVTALGRDHDVAE
jgi:hypothetical protein